MTQPKRIFIDADFSLAPSIGRSGTEILGKQLMLGLGKYYPNDDSRDDSKNDNKGTSNSKDNSNH